MKNVIILILSGFAWSCVIPTHRIRILQFPGQRQGNAYDSLIIKRVGLATFSDSIVVKLADKRKLKLSPNEVWGYQDDDSSLWRYSEGQFYLVRQLDTPTIYSRKHSVGKGTHNHYYFSVNPYSHLYSFRWKDIEREFTSTPCFLDKLRNLSFFKAYDSYDHKQKSYRFVTLFQECDSQKHIEKTN